MKKMMKQKIFGPLLILFFLSMASPEALWAQALPIEEIVAKVQEQYDTHEDFKASFVQESLVKSLGKKQVAEGMVYFKKPGKMRWN